jgi:hypothetical protein
VPAVGLNSGSADSFHVSARWGLRPKARQIRETDDCDSPVSSAIDLVDQCVSWPGPFSVRTRVIATSTCSSVIFRGAPGRFASVRPFSSASVSADARRRSRPPASRGDRCCGCQRETGSLGSAAAGAAGHRPARLLHEVACLPSMNARLLSSSSAIPAYGPAAFGGVDGDGREAGAGAASRVAPRRGPVCAIRSPARLPAGVPSPMPTS